MRILLYNDLSGPWGGVESHIQILLSELRRAGHEVKLFAFAERLPSRRGLAGKLRFLQRSQSYDPRLASVLRSRLHDFQPDLIHCHNNRLFTNTVCRELQSYEAPVLSSLHDHDLLDFASQPYSLKAKIKRRQFRMIRQMSRQVSVPTRRMQQQLGRLGLPATYLPYFLSEREWGSGFAERLDSEQIQLLYVGRMIRPKGIFRLLEALHLLVQQGYSPRLTCVGDGPDR
ncbi:MAG: glycosyltransferase family 4 protein, partial [Bacteroidota bacterium]